MPCRKTLVSDWIMTMPDYGNGMTNIDFNTGIRYGVISAQEVCQAWYDDAEADYGDPHCPKCGNDAVESGKEIVDFGEEDTPENRDEYRTARGACGDYACDRCKYLFDADEAFGDEPISHNYEHDGYVATCDSDRDIFVIKSPYYTYAPFCSPCAPGAGYLASASEHDETTGVKTYCFDKSWF